MKTLLFVYNGDGGSLNSLIHLLHKTFSPKTYACNLCKIIYGPLGMRAEWKSFIASIGRTVTFLHRDEFHLRYGLQNILLPAVFTESNENRAELWIDANSINAIKSVDELKKLIVDRMRKEPTDAVHATSVNPKSN